MDRIAHCPHWSMRGPPSHHWPRLFDRPRQLIILNYYFSELHWIAHLKLARKRWPLSTSVFILSPTQVTASRREISPHLPSGFPGSQRYDLLRAIPSLPLQVGKVPTQYVYHVGTSSLSSLQVSEWRGVTPTLEVDHNGLWTKAPALWILGCFEEKMLVFHVWM